MGYCFVDLSHQPADLLPAGRRELFKDLIRQWQEKIESKNPELIVRSFEPLEPICEWFFTVQAH
ncbi:MAG: hypothetical protein KAW56_10160 [Candidatus Marinimicrobia bacterium]|nr:hypothetical protein [Candidatus Neomarinimicrobiota bacterium]